MDRRTVKNFEKYPYLEDKEKKNRKVFEEDVIEILKLKKAKFSLTQISRIMKISTTTVRYWYQKEREKGKFEKTRNIRKQYCNLWYEKNKDNPKVREKFRKNNEKVAKRIRKFKKEKKCIL